MVGGLAAILAFDAVPAAILDAVLPPLVGTVVFFAGRGLQVVQLLFGQATREEVVRDDVAHFGRVVSRHVNLLQVI